MSKKLGIFIDSCAWNFLYDHGINLSKELPVDEFDLFVTKEVGSFEIPEIPEEKKGLAEYIRKQREERGVKEDSYFGFSSYNDPPEKRYRIGGFGEGRFATYRDAEVLKKFQIIPAPGEKEGKTGLYKNEADASLAVRAGVGNVVLTAEKLNKGPLKKASSEYGRVVSLLGFNPSNQSLKNYIISSVKPNKH